MTRVDESKVSAIEAVLDFGEYEQLLVVEVLATIPLWQWPAHGVGEQRMCCGISIDCDDRAVATNGVSGEGCNWLHQDGS